MAMRTHNIFNKLSESKGFHIFPPVVIQAGHDPATVFFMGPEGQSVAITKAILYRMGTYEMLGSIEVHCTIDFRVPDLKASMGIMARLFALYDDVLEQYIESGREDEQDFAFIYTRYLLFIASSLPEYARFVQVMAANGYVLSREGATIYKDAPNGDIDALMAKYRNAVSYGNPEPATPAKPVAEPVQNNPAVKKPYNTVNATIFRNSVSKEPAEKVISAAEKRVTMESTKRETMPEQKPAAVQKPDEQSPAPKEILRDVKNQAKPAPQASVSQVKTVPPVKQADQANNSEESVLERTVPGLKAYNTALARMKGRGLFHAIVFTDGESFFSNCVAKEAGILYEKKVLESAEVLTDGKSENRKACILGSDNADMAREAINNGAYVFFKGKAPSGIQHNAFNISGAGVVIAEERLEAMELSAGCDLATVMAKYPGWDRIPGDVFVNNTLMAHFSSGAVDDDRIIIVEKDFEWIAGWLAKSDSGRNSIPVKPAAKNGAGNINDASGRTDKPAANTSAASPNNAVKPVGSGTASTPQAVVVKPAKTETVSTVKPPAANRPAGTVSEQPVIQVPASEPVAENKPVAQETAAEAVQEPVPPVTEPEAVASEADIGHDRDIRLANIKIKDAIVAENKKMFEIIKAARNSRYDPIRQAYDDAVKSGDHNFRGCAYCNKIYKKDTNAVDEDDFYKTQIYFKIYHSQKAVEDLAAKITPVKRHASCFFCRNKWDEDVSVSPDGPKDTVCPACGKELKVIV